MSQVSLTVGIQLTTQEVNGRTLPAIAVSKADLQIDSDHLEITVGSGAIRKILGHFVNLFKGKIRGIIQSQVSHQL